MNLRSIRMQRERTEDRARLWASFGPHTKGIPADMGIKDFGFFSHLFSGRSFPPIGDKMVSEKECRFRF